jgi:hypothetical protein
MAVVRQAVLITGHVGGCGGSSGCAAGSGHARGDARPDELAAAYNERWEEETGNDQLKTHLRGPGKVLRSRLPDLVHQEIWAYLIVHHAISALTAKARRQPTSIRIGSRSPRPYA